MPRHNGHCIVVNFDLCVWKMVPAYVLPILPHPHAAIRPASPNLITICRGYNAHRKAYVGTCLPITQPSKPLGQVPNVIHVKSITLPLSDKQVRSTWTPV